MGPQHVKGKNLEWYPSIGQQSAVAFDGHDTVVLGRAVGKVLVGETSISVTFIVVSGVSDVLLGADALSKLGVMNSMQSTFEALGARVSRAAAPHAHEVSAVYSFPTDIYESVEAFDKLNLDHIDADLRERFRDELKKRRRAFVKAECLPPTCTAPPVKLVLKPGAGQPAVMKQRAWSPAVEAQHDYHEQRRLHFDTAVMINSTTQYERRAEPILVHKPDGTTRQVIDATLINPQLVTDTYPIPLIPQQLAKLHNFSRASKFDMAEGYAQCKLDEESWVHTIWRTVRGLMASKVLMAGQSPAAGLFCRTVKENLIDRLEQGYGEQTAYYFDDIAHGTIAADDRAAQVAEIAYVLAFLDACLAGRHTLRLAKCTFVHIKITFAGMELVQGMKRPLPERIASIVNFAPIDTKKDLNRLVSMGEPWRNSIKGFFLLSDPLRTAARGRGPLAKSQELTNAIEKFRNAFAKIAFAAIPDLTADFDVYVDTGETATGYIIEQRGRFVACGGRFLTSRERALCPYDREWLGYVNYLEKSEPLIGGAFSNIFGDQKMLQGLGSEPIKPVNRNMSGARPDFMERSSRFRFKVIYLSREHPKMLAVDAITKSPEFRNIDTSATVPASTPTASATVPASTPTTPSTPAPTIAAMVAQLVVTAPDRTSAATWRERQQRDVQYATLIKFKETGELPLDMKPERAKGITAQAAHYELVDGALYHIKVSRGTTSIQLAVPDVDWLRQDRLRAAHEVDSLHEGPKKMFERLSTTFHWDEMLADCFAYFHRCDPCIANITINNKYGLLDPTTSAKLDGKERLGLDLAGPFDDTEDGNRFIAIAVSYRSGRIITFPLKDKENATVIHGLRTFVIPFTGVPDDLVSDRAPEFHADLPQAFYASFGINKQTSTPGHPQTDGMAEAGVKLAKTKIRILVATKSKNWCRYIGDINMSLASEFKLPNGMSPYKAETGRDFRSPSFFEYPLAHLGVDHPTIKDLADLHLKLSASRDNAAAKMKAYYDIGRVPAPFKTGDLVWLRNQNPNNTLDPRRLGPYRVKEMLSDLAVRLTDLPQGPSLGRKHPVVSVADLEVYQGALVTTAHNNHVLLNITKHKLVLRGKKGEKRKVPLYRAKWDDKSETWEPARNLIDEDENGFITNQSLQDYWDRHPQLKVLDGYGTAPL